jgi:hypothetical protein
MSEPKTWREAMADVPNIDLLTQREFAPSVGDSFMAARELRRRHAEFAQRERATAERMGRR